MVGGIIDGGLFIPAYTIHKSGHADYDNVYMCSGSRATLDKLLDNVEKPDRKGDKDIKGFVKAALDHFESAAKKNTKQKNNFTKQKNSRNRTMVFHRFWFGVGQEQSP